MDYFLTNLFDFEYFPYIDIADQYIEPFASSNYDIHIEPRNYWQDTIYSVATINMNSIWSWSWVYPEWNWVFIESEIEDFLKIKKIPNYNIKYNFHFKSIYEIDFLSLKNLKHHDYANTPILTNNFYSQYLSNNNIQGLNGLYICWYDHFGSLEIFLQQLYGYTIQFGVENFCESTTFNRYVNIDVQSPYYGWYNSTPYFRCLNDLDLSFSKGSLENIYTKSNLK